ncbi:MAG: AgmX/PglI C-terminal domain-containing protein [Pseudomonadota bacterium]
MAASPPRKPAAKTAAPRPKLVKVLRIGIIQDGKIVQEKRIEVGSTVTIGASPKATFSYPLPKVPRKFPLFVAKGDSYFLRYLPSMKGKIGQTDKKDTVQRLDELNKPGGAAKRKGDVFVLPLTHKNRGTISIENVTLLFQFVSAPPEPLTPTRKTDFRPKLFDSDDPVFLGFLGLFTLLAAVFAVYVQSVPTPALLGDELMPERFVRLVLPPTDVKPPEDIEDKPLDGDGPAMAKKKEEPQPGEGAEGQAKDTHPKTAEERAAEEIRRKQQMEAEVMNRSLLLKMIGTRGESSSGTYTDDLFGDGEGVGTDLDAALAEVGGVEQGTLETLGEKRGTGTGTGRDDASIGDLAKAHGNSSDVGSGPATKVSGRVSSGTVDVTGGDPAKIKGTIAKYTGQVKACYELQLKSNPTLSGRIEMLWNINNGRVTKVEVLDNSTDDDALAQCIAQKVRSWRFPTDLEPDAEVMYPFILSPG